MIGSSANVMIVPPSRPWKNIQDFIADAKAKPGSISFGSVGIGSAVHISAEKFRYAAGIEATHVPYRGGAEVIADIIGGRVDFYFCPLATALPLIRGGQVHALVVSTAQRVPDLPDVPAPREAGLKERRKRRSGSACSCRRRRRATSSTNFMPPAPRCWPSPAMRDKLKTLGVEPMPMKPAEMDALRQARDRWLTPK